MGRKKDSLQQRSAKLTQQRRFRYDDSKPFIELFKPKYRPMLKFGKAGRELKSLLKDGDKVNLSTLTYLEFRLTAEPGVDKAPCTHKKINQWLAGVLKITGSEGTQYGKAMIFRYITNGHSNLSIDELSLKTAVDKAVPMDFLTKV